ncbi:MAG: GNAT family N-acetyltransferase [Alphaproteobacteria bacterium]|nr:GNAT family N-acetyltransferase [Alphaproteobacteria bacterium]
MIENDFFESFPEIDLGDVLLRKIHLEDIEDFFKYITHKEVVKFLADTDIPSNLDSAKIELMYWASLYERKRSIFWAISDKKDGKLIGTCGFNSWSRDHRRAEISYDLSCEYWNKGIMTKIVDAISKFGFDVMKVKRIQATIAIFNSGSVRVLEKCGYQREGVLKNFGIIHGKQEDYYMYSKIIDQTTI